MFYYLLPWYLYLCKFYFFVLPWYLYLVFHYRLLFLMYVSISLKLNYSTYFIILFIYTYNKNIRRERKEKKDYLTILYICFITMVHLYLRILFLMFQFHLKTELPGYSTYFIILCIIYYIIIIHLQIFFFHKIYFTFVVFFLFVVFFHIFVFVHIHNHITFIHFIVVGGRSGRGRSCTIRCLKH